MSWRIKYNQKKKMYHQGFKDSDENDWHILKLFPVTSTLLLAYTCEHRGEWAANDVFLAI